MKEHHELTPRVTEIRDLQRSIDTPAASLPVYGYGVENSGEGEVHLRDYWRSVRKHLWLVIGTTALITMLAAIYMARKPDLYEAEARVQVDLENSDPSVGGTAKTGSIVVNTRGFVDPAYFNTQLQILNSPGLLRRVVKTLDLEHNKAFLNPNAAQSGSTWQKMVRMVGLGKDKKGAEKDDASAEVPLASTVAPATSREDLVEAKKLAPYVETLQKGLKVEPVKETRLQVKDTRLIDVSFVHQDPQIAAKIVNAIADVFALSNLERKTETNTTTGDFLQKRIAELQSQIRGGEERLINYAKSNQILSLDASQNTVVDRLAGLNRQLLEAENERKLAEAAYRAALSPGAAEALSEDTTKQVSEMEVKLAELRSKRAELLVENTEEWPEVKEVTQQIAALEKQIKDTRGRATSVVKTNLETRYRQALQREQSLRTAFNQQRGETLTQNEAAINYRIIQQEIETNKNLLEGLLQRSKENDVVLAARPNNIHVIDYALAPDVPVAPKRLRGVAIAFMLSLVFGVGLALFLEYLDDTVRNTDDVEKRLQLPALAMIPTSATVMRRRLLPGVTALQPRHNGNGHGNSELLLNADARSPLAEAYRQLRTSVLLSTAGHAPKTILVTSSVPSEGKTTTAVNLAISLAQTGASVLVIDADMRRPRLHSIFELNKRSSGLSTILSSQMSEQEVFALIERHEPSGLCLLRSGSIPPNPAELIGSDQMRRLITILQSAFTHIVIDSPPIASFTDGVLLASMVDGVLLVVHDCKSSRTIVRRSRQLLQEVGAKILGVVVNNVDVRSHDYYYYQRYYQQAYYSTTAENEPYAST